MIKILYIIGIFGFLINCSNKHEVKVQNKIIHVNTNNWKILKNDFDFSENFESKEKKKYQVFKEIITIYKKPMSSEDKKGLQIENKTFVEFINPTDDSITIQIRIDKDFYWLLSRNTINLMIKLDNSHTLNNEALYIKYKDYISGEIQDIIYRLNEF